jgi:hypothetical protein
LSVATEARVTGCGLSQAVNALLIPVEILGRTEALTDVNAKPVPVIRTSESVAVITSRILEGNF